jgi:superfamily I DNA/RNA helicase/RecB family exonuclease
MPAPHLNLSAQEPSRVQALDAAQERVVAWRGPGICVVLGSPGTGATTALLEAVVARVSEASPSRTLFLARDRDAVRRMRTALARRMSSGSLPTVTTFHGLAYALVRRTTGPGSETAMPRLLSGAEEDARIRDLLRGAIADGEVPWPADLLAASATLGFANDVRAMLARARELGLGPDDLDAVAAGAGVPAWQTLGRLAEIDADVMALEGVIDYGGLLELAIEAAGSWQGELSHVYVDDFQEAGPLQRQLLQALTGPATATVVAADPDIAAFGFRGGDRNGALRLADEARAEIIVLDRVHAGTGAIRAAYDAVRRQPALPGLSAPLLHAYRYPDSDTEPDAEPGRVDVVGHDTWGDLVAWVADDLRRRHLGHEGADPVPWSDMAVVSRSTSHLEGLRRALTAAGIPVVMAGSDLALPDEPAVATLLSAASAAIAPGDVGVSSAVDLVTGPLLALDPADLRALARALRERFRAAHPGEPAPPGTELVRDLLVEVIADPQAVREVTGSAHEACARVMALGRALAAVRASANSGAAPGEVLWQVWSSAIPDSDGFPWPERLRRSALAGHAPSGHDIDAVLALFATAERLSDRYAGVVGIRGLLAALHGQRVAAERVAAAAPTTPAVSLLTAHLAVGRHWEHVVIVGAQEGAWPPPLGGSSALRLAEWESIVTGGGATDARVALRAAAADRMAQERRLFALAVSRARTSLTIATVSSDSEQPSRFIDDLGVDPRHRSGRPARPLTIDGLIARLRSVAQDPDASSSLRRAAVQRLAVLAEAVDDAGMSLAPRADPATWWGLVEPTPGIEPIRPADRPVALSGSGLVALQGCPLRWFLSRVVRAEGPRGRALAIGSLVHAMAERAARGQVPADPEVMLGEIDRVWAELPFDAPWEAQAERAEVAGALSRLCTYLRDADEALAVEQEFVVTIPLARDGEGDGDDEFIVRGAIDRVEISADGRVRLIDFKTARTPPSGPSVESDLQLGTYQLAVQHGALGDLVSEPEVGGAALVQLRVDASGDPGRPRIQEQPALGDGAWLADDIAAAIARVRAEDFPAVISSDCRTCPYAVACPAQPAGREVLA